MPKALLLLKIYRFLLRLYPDSESASYVWERDLSSASGFFLMHVAYSSNESGSMSSMSSRFRDLGDEGDSFVPGKPPVH